MVKLGMAFGFVLLTLIVVLPATAVDCSTFPAKSLSRAECETTAARIKVLPGPDAGTANLGQVPLGTGMIPLDLSSLCGSVRQYLGVNVVLRGVTFKRLLSTDSATFGETGGCELLVSGLHRSVSFSAGGSYDIVVLPLGTTKGTNAYGATVILPHALFMGLP
jgi:hypothetical protein